MPRRIGRDVCVIASVLAWAVVGVWTHFVFGMLCLCYSLPRDPADFESEYERLIQQAVELDFRKHNDDTLKKVEAKFATRDDRRHARRVLNEGVEVGDRVLIEEALEIHQRLKQDGFGETLDADALGQAEATLLLIEKEDKVLAKVRQAMVSGRPKVRSCCDGCAMHDVVRFRPDLHCIFVLL